MPKRKDLKKILVVGAGPIIIGQACEFDYSGTQACKALKDEGFKVILINSNPATIMTDPDTADVVYIEKDNIKYYYVAKSAVPASFPPPNTDYWIADRCSKTLKGCKLRWGLAGAAKSYTNPPTNTTTGASRKLLPFGGFPGTNTKMTSQ